MTEFITRDNFEALAAEFLETQDDEKSDEWYCTDHDFAHYVLEKLRDHLFGDADAKKERHAQYLALKAEFDPELK